MAPILDTAGASGGEVVRLASAAREHDLVRVTAEEAGDLGARPIEVAFAARPAAWLADGLANGASRSGRITATTRGSMGVLAL